MASMPGSNSHSRVRLAAIGPVARPSSLPTMRPRERSASKKKVWSLTRRFFSSTSSRARPVSSLTRLAMRLRCVSPRREPACNAAAYSSWTKLSAATRAACGDAANGPCNKPWYCATLAKAGRNSANGRSLAGAKTMLCKSIAHDTRIKPESTTPISCSLLDIPAPRVVP